MSNHDSDATVQTASDSEDGKAVRIRRLIERKMVESWQNKPHFSVTVAVDMTDIIRFRKDLGITINDFIMAASSAALKEHPWVNSHWIDDEAVEQEEINLAVAVATEGGLFYPVVKNVEKLSLKQLGESILVSYLMKIRKVEPLRSAIWGCWVSSPLSQLLLLLRRLS
jgi:pyruvate/2-oxoglutarate dehydrogenase complex dihydrolipoamide acyltransferase (E2) component